MNVRERPVRGRTGIVPADYNSILTRIRVQVVADGSVVEKTVSVWSRFQEYAQRIQTHGHEAITASMRQVLMRLEFFRIRHSHFLS